MLSKYTTGDNDSPSKHSIHCPSYRGNSNWDSGLGSSIANSANSENFPLSGNSRRDEGYQTFLSQVTVPTPRMEGNYSSEEDRLKTFTNWPVEQIVKARDVAHAGFIATGNADRAKCVYCLGSMYNWDENDDPVQEHYKHFRGCALVKYCIESALHSNLRFFAPPKPGENMYSISYVNDNWSDLVSVCLVIKLGYSDSCVSKAKNIFLRNQKIEIPKHFSGELLDIVVKIEDDEVKETEMRTQMSSLALSEGGNQTAHQLAGLQSVTQGHTSSKSVLETDNDDSLLQDNSISDSILLLPSGGFYSSAIHLPGKTLFKC